jgi:aldehyde:ferredoxin oxidoreductase
MSAKQNFNRRDFLKISGLYAVGGLLAACGETVPPAVEPTGTPPALSTPSPDPSPTVSPTASPTATALPPYHGFNGRVLYVDLSSGQTHSETLPEETYRLFPGGKALAAYLLLRNIPANADPLGPQNVLVLSAGLLTGFPISTATRFSAAARSPLTGAYGESEAGGYWGTELRRAGYEAVVLTGRSPTPVYLLVENERVELREAAHLWGKPPEEVQDAIRLELQDTGCSVLQTGLAGENLVRYAALSHNMRHYNGRTGMGAVMGSKNLKAVVVHGNDDLNASLFDPTSMFALGKALASGVKDHPQSWDMRVKGTPALTGALDAAGILPTRNFRQGSFEGAANLAWEAYEKNLLKGRSACHVCAVACKREVSIDARWKVGRTYGGPEYETVAGFGPNCGVDDLSAVAKANELCNRYILDTISTSATIAFAMECFENGLIGLPETGGLDLRFGNAEAMLQAIELIATRQGFGAQMAEGTLRLSKLIGAESEKFAVQVKGEEVAMHDPRGKVGVGLGYAVCETGADHLVSYHDTLIAKPGSVSLLGAAPLGISEAIPARELSPQKARAYCILENWSSAGKALGMCYFGPAPRSYVQVEQVLTAVKAATGWDVDVDELLRVGERATNLARIFNLREGFSSADDRLPERLFAPLENGALQGTGISQAAFTATLNEVYRIKQWDLPSSRPSPQRLADLQIEWAGELLPG